MGRDRVALFAAIREDHRKGEGIREIARKYGVHRRTVREAEADAREEASRVRDDAARERETLRDSRNAQLEAQRALTDAERTRAERAEAQLDTERADRRQLTSHITGNGHEPQTATVLRHASRPVANERGPSPGFATGVGPVSSGKPLLSW